MKKLFALLVLAALLAVFVVTQLAKQTPKSKEKASTRSLTEYRDVARKPSDS
jgi:hypothetical protein